MAERTIPSTALYRLRPLTWEKSTMVPNCSTARLLGTGISVRLFDGQWRYSGPGFTGYRVAESRPDAKRRAVAALLEWIEEAFSKETE